jgi:hypothetical protein
MKTTTKSKRISGGRSIDPRFIPVVDAFATKRDVTFGKLMASVGLKVNGKIFAMLVRGQLVIKLPRQRVNELVQAGKGEHFDPRRDGRLMKEWLVFTGGPGLWIELASEAYRFVRSKT